MTLSINGKTYEAGELIAYVQNLEKENAELKKELVEKGQHLDLTEKEWGKDTTKLIHFKTQLTKAKELIENLLYYVKQCTCERSNYAEIEKDIKEAEQFLKEE